VLRLPIAHGEGNYVIDDDGLARLQDNDQVVYRYTTAEGIRSPDSNPNGSLDDIAGICNIDRNIVGMMPHPERASESVLGSMDGLTVWESLLSGASA
jgi:phosphoribosylformylglycinamidine synthase